MYNYFILNQISIQGVKKLPKGVMEEEFKSTKLISSRLYEWNEITIYMNEYI